MRFDQVMALRPKAGDSASIQAAIDAAKAAGDTARRRADELEAWRKASLLSAADEEMEAAEREAAEARRGAERIDALIEAMRTELGVATRREAVERVLAAVADANAKATRFAEAWREKYAGAAATIHGILQLEAEAVRAAEEAREARKKLCDAKMATDEELPHPQGVHGDLFGHWTHVMGKAVQLPGPNGELDERSFWRPERHEFRRHWPF